MSTTIRPARRTLATACRKIGVAVPESPEALGPIFLELLVNGIATRYDGSDVWWSAIFDYAPPEPTRLQ